MSKDDSDAVSHPILAGKRLGALRFSGPRLKFHGRELVMRCRFANSRFTVDKPQATAFDALNG
jgi:hypothetical protein